MKIDGFDWDLGNSIKSYIKHGISRSEAEETFSNQPLVVPDIKHSSFEDRYIAFGQAKSGRKLTIAFTLRKKKRLTLLRIISARPMNYREKRIYEKANPKI